MDVGASSLARRFFVCVFTVSVPASTQNPNTARTPSRAPITAARRPGVQKGGCDRTLSESIPGDRRQTFSNPASLCSASHFAEYTAVPLTQTLAPTWKFSGACSLSGAEICAYTKRPPPSSRTASILSRRQKSWTSPVTATERAYHDGTIEPSGISHSSRGVISTGGGIEDSSRPVFFTSAAKRRVVWRVRGFSKTPSTVIRSPGSNRCFGLPSIEMRQSIPLSARMKK